MKIANVNASLVRIPVEKPTSISTRQLSSREYVLVSIESDSGETGHGYTYAGTVAGYSTFSFVEDVFIPLLLNCDPHLIEHLWSKMYQEVLLSGRRGAAIRALSAVDIALWDLLAKSAGLPLYRLLGGSSDRVPAYASGGYYRPGDLLGNVRDEITAYQALGFTDFKIKVGGSDFDTDVARVKVARETIGSSGRLALDANNAWKWPHEAIRFARAVETADIWWLEEPLSPDDFEGHAEVARTLEMPVATGEIHATRWEFRQLIEHHSADILQPDAAVLGGISEYMKIAHCAASFNLPLAPHWHANLHAQLIAAVSNGLTVEFFALEQDIYNFERLLTPDTRLRPTNGEISLPDRHGIGIEFDQEAINRWRVNS